MAPEPDSTSVDVPSAAGGAPTGTHDDGPNDDSTVIGVVGGPGRATVSPAGAVIPWSNTGNDAALEWFVAAEDRWHVPAEEVTVRQQRLDGTPVVETLVRVPGGNAVQRVFAAAEAGGVIVVELENDSSMPFAVAFSGRPVVTERPVSDVPIKGIELPDDAIVLPIAHRAVVRVVLGLDPDTPALTAFPSRLPDSAAVARGWLATCERASRLVLPDEALATSVVEWRCDLLLDGPVLPDADPVGFVIDAAELVRLGEPAEPWLVEAAAVLERIVPRRKRRGERHAVADQLVAIEAVASIADAAGDDRAVADAAAMRSAIERSAATGAADDHVSTQVSPARTLGRRIRSVERTLADRGDVLPGGFPQAWLGANFEVHGLPTGAGSSLSFAVRWHGERPALLWEQHGAPVRLTASALDPAWSTDAPAGETLLAAPQSSS